MAEFVAFNQDVEVNGQTIHAFVDSGIRGREKLEKIINKHGIDPKPNEWYSQQSWLNAFKEVSEIVGEMTLFLMGTAIIDNAEFPPISNLKEGLMSIDVAYHMNHRLNGEVMFNPETGEMLDGIGHYQLLSFDEEARKAVMRCNNPYPSKFDEGIINAVVRRFRPKDSKKALVKVDINQERRTKGADSCTYLINW